MRDARHGADVFIYNTLAICPTAKLWIAIKSKYILPHVVHASRCHTWSNQRERLHCIGNFSTWAPQSRHWGVNIQKMRPDTQLTFIAPKQTRRTRTFWRPQTAGQTRKALLACCVGNCVHGKWVSETHVLWPRTWVEDRGDLKKTRDGDSKLCRALAICILCKYLSQCVISFSSQYCKSKQGKRAGKQALGGRGGFSRGP